MNTKKFGFFVGFFCLKVKIEICISRKALFKNLGVFILGKKSGILKYSNYSGAQSALIPHATISHPNIKKLCLNKAQPIQIHTCYIVYPTCCIPSVYHVCISVSRCAGRCNPVESRNFGTTTFAKTQLLRQGFCDPTSCMVCCSNEGRNQIYVA